MKREETAELLTNHVEEYKNRDTLNELIKLLRESPLDVSDDHIRYCDERAKLGDALYTRERKIDVEMQKGE